VKLRTVDTHCHLFLVEQEASDVVEAARAVGVEKLLCVGVDPRSSHQSLEAARALPGVAATAGLHPHDATTLPESRVELETLAADSRVLAIGETGLDFFRWHSPQEDQETNLRFHCELSRATGKPMIIHCRDAWERTLAILDEEVPPMVVLHCFSGDEALARACVERGWFVSFAGPVTYPKNETLRDAAIVVPIDRILVETDSPYLAPQPVRGKVNVPANIVHTVEQIAHARGMETLEFAEATYANALRAFPGLSEA